jgi:dihydroflavonol-4-reductase
LQVFLTGGTGFIGGVVARKLTERGDSVKALVRSPEKATALQELGCELVHGDLSDDHVMQAAMVGCDAVIHGAAVYSVGIADKDRHAMFEANVRGTERVLRAALHTEVPRVVYVSTVNAFGDTQGEVVAEDHEHSEQYVSYYDETKHKAHKIAKILIAEHGLPGIIVQPGLVYGPNDSSEMGNLMRMYLRKRMPIKILPTTGLTACYVDDVADGIILALDKGRIGESYVLGGEITRSGLIFDTLAKIMNRKPQRFSLPVGMMKASIPVARFINPLMGFPPNMREMISAANNVTYWARCDKARDELGYSPRSLDQGLRDMLAAEGIASSSS